MHVWSNRDILSPLSIVEHKSVEFICFEQYVLIRGHLLRNPDFYTATFILSCVTEEFPRYYTIMEIYVQREQNTACSCNDCAHSICDDKTVQGVNENDVFFYHIYNTINSVNGITLETYE